MILELTSRNGAREQGLKISERTQTMMLCRTGQGQIKQCAMAMQGAREISMIQVMCSNCSMRRRRMWWWATKEKEEVEDRG